MNEEIEYVKIKCPKCGSIVIGKISGSFPFDSYYGYCRKCNYHITESEFEEVML